MLTRWSVLCDGAPLSIVATRADSGKLYFSCTWDATGIAAFRSPVVVEQWSDGGWRAFGDDRKNVTPEAAIESWIAHKLGVVSGGQTQ